MSIVIWADDDSAGLLRPLLRFLVSGGFNVQRVESYEAACTEIRKLEGSGTAFSLLADIILPISEGRGALSPYLGLDLAEKALRANAVVVVFLSVVPSYEVAADLERL